MKKKFFVLDVDYELKPDFSPAIKLYCKDEENKNVILKVENFYPYFYILPVKGKENELKRIVEKLKFEKNAFLKVDKVEKIIGKEKRIFLRVTASNPRKIPDIRKYIKDTFENLVEETFEYDIPFYKRFLIDFQISPVSWLLAEVEKIDESTFLLKEIIEKDVQEREPKLKIIAFDIEMVEIENKEKIIIISLVGNNGYKKAITFQPSSLNFVDVVKNEKSLLKKFVEEIQKQDPDVIVGYNTDLFDFIKIKEKAEEYGIELRIGRKREKIKTTRRGREIAFKIPGRIYLDLYKFVENILAPTLKSEVLTLDEVANEILGVRKKELSWMEMVEKWKSKNIDIIVEYNVWDSELTLKLAEVFIPQIFAISKLTSVLPFDACRYAYSQLVENYYMKNAFLENRIIPNRPKFEEIQRRRLEASYKGAIVFEPKTGLVKNLVVMDFRSLYPTIIITHNISPETFNCEHAECKEKNRVPELNYYFCVKKVGFIPKYLRQILEKRIEIKKKMKILEKNSEEYKLLDNMQYALKIIANSTYGYLAYVGARWYKKECAASTTAFERYYIKKIAEMALENDWEIIYGDTDSLMLVHKKEKEPEKIKSLAIQFLKKVNDSMPGVIELEYRGFYPRAIFVKRREGGGAKKRYALLAEDGNLEIRGFETVRRDWCNLAKKVQRKVLEIILKEGDIDKAIKYVKDVIKQIKERKIKYEDLIIFEQITKPLHEYKQISPHVVAAKKALKRGKLIGEGSIIPFVITKYGSSISEKAEPAEDVGIDDIDTNYYITNQIVPAALRVLSAFHIKEGDLLSESRQSGLLKFLKKG